MALGIVAVSVTGCGGQVQRAVAREIPYMPLWYKTNIAVFQPDLSGVRLSPIADFTFLKDVSRSPAR